MAIEADLEKPENSALFKKYPVILADHHMVEFITDCLRLIVGGNLDPHELESLLEYELETHHKEAHEPAHAVQKVADALPGFGIVAAVLGIVNTMAALEGADTADDRPQGRRGAGRHLPRHSRRRTASSARSPRRWSIKAHEEGKAFEVVKMALVASVRGYRAAGRRGVRAQAAVQRSAPDVRRPRSAAQGQARRRSRPRNGGHADMAGDAKATSARSIIKRIKKVGGRPSRRRVEGGVRGLRHRDDGVLPGDVAGHRRVEGTARGDLRLLQESQHGARQEREARAGQMGPGGASTSPINLGGGLDAPQHSLQSTSQASARR